RTLSRRLCCLEQGRLLGHVVGRVLLGEGAQCRGHRDLLSGLLGAQAAIVARSASTSHGPVRPPEAPCSARIASNSARGMARKPMASMVGVKSLPSLRT